MAKTTAALKRLPRAWVELIEQPPDAAAFRRALEATDLLLLPYQAEVYRRRSSGLLVQAMALGIPTVVPEETWLAAKAPAGAHVTFGVGIVLAQAVQSAIDNYPMLVAKARESELTAWETLTARILVEKLIETCRQSHVSR